VIITPTRVYDDVRPTIGIEKLFDTLKERQAQSRGKQQTRPDIRPSSVIRYENDENQGWFNLFCFSDDDLADRKLSRSSITHLANGLLEVDGAIDAPQYDRASVEPAPQVEENVSLPCKPLFP